MARPKQLVNRDTEVRIRFTALEKKSLELIAQKTGLSVSAYLRRAAFNQSVQLRFTAEELALYKELHQFRNGLAVIGNLVKMHKGSDELLAAITQLKNQLASHLQKFES